MLGVRGAPDRRELAAVVLAVHLVLSADGTPPAPAGAPAWARAARLEGVGGRAARVPGDLPGTRSS